MSNRSNFLFIANLIFVFLTLIIIFKKIFIYEAYQDEDYAILLSLYPNEVDFGVNLFFYLNHWILYLFNYHWLYLRIFTLIVYFSVIYTSFRETFKFFKVYYNKFNLIFLATLSTYIYFIKFPIHPSYNFYSIIGLNLIYVIFLKFLFENDKFFTNKKIFLNSLVCSFGIFLITISKISLIFFLFILLIFIIKKNRSNRKLYLYFFLNIFFYTIQLIIFLFFVDKSLPEIFQFYISGIEIWTLSEPRYMTSNWFFYFLDMILYYLSSYSSKVVIVSVLAGYVFYYLQKSKQHFKKEYLYILFFVFFSSFFIIYKSMMSLSYLFFLITNFIIINVFIIKDFLFKKKIIKNNYIICFLFLFSLFFFAYEKNIKILLGYKNQVFISSLKGKYYVDQYTHFNFKELERIKDQYRKYQYASDLYGNLHSIILILDKKFVKFPWNFSYLVEEEIISNFDKYKSSSAFFLSANQFKKYSNLLNQVNYEKYNIKFYKNYKNKPDDFFLIFPKN